ncbi:hypothetical protein BLD25_02880 [Candidatus Gracilibacteria bacterium GN02-872]|jgi:hypothetical protein|nr:hypothetical protein BLD25_02880 [Candidatus Gracilibacteria bacterium GN02-872]
MKEQYSLAIQPVVPTSINTPVYKNCILYEEGGDRFFILSDDKMYIAKFRYKVVKNDLEYINEFILDDKLIGMVLDCDRKLTVDFLTYHCYKQYYDEGNNDHIIINGIMLFSKEGY